MSEIEHQETTSIVDYDILEAVGELGRRVTALSQLSSQHLMPNVNLNTTLLNLDTGDRINITIAFEGDDPDDTLSNLTVDLFIGLSTHIHKDIVPTLAYWSCWKKLRGC